MAQGSMSLLHPLAEPLSQWRNHRNQASIDFDDPQPVLLNGNIYMKGQCGPNGRLRLWKYSISAGIFSELQCPRTCYTGEDDRYLLASFKSHLLLVHARFTWPNIQFPNKENYDEFIVEDSNDPRQIYHKLELLSYKLLETEWGEGRHMHSMKCTDPLYDLDWCDYESLGSYGSFCRDNRIRNPKHWDASITSNDNYLFVGFFRTDKYNGSMSDREYLRFGCGPFINVKILIFNESLKLVQCVEGPSFDDNEDINTKMPIIFVQDDNFYVKVWTNFENTNFQKASLKSITADQPKSSFAPYVDWHCSHSIPEKSSNLTLLKNQPIIGASKSTADSESKRFYLCALTSCKPGDTWVELANFNFQFDSAPVVIGLPDGIKVVAIGMVKAVPHLSQELHVLEVVPQVTAYHPDSRFNLGAINRLQVGAGINLLSTLEKSLESLGDLQRLAGFDLSESIEPFYSTNSMIPKYINKWTACSNCSRRPTWKFFLSILRELKEDSIADQIETYLKESTAHIKSYETQKSFNGSEEVGFLKHQLNSLYQELDKGVAIAESVDSVKERVKTCLDQSQVAFDKLRLEKQDFLDRIEKLTQEKQEIKDALETLEQQADIGMPPAKRVCTRSETNDFVSAAVGPQQQPTLKIVQKELYNTVASKWEDIGIQLNIEDGQLAKVKADCSDSGSCLREMLRIWLKRVDPKPSWRELIEALNDLGEEKRADDIRQKILSNQITSDSV